MEQTTVDRKSLLKAITPGMIGMAALGILLLGPDSANATTRPSGSVSPELAGEAKTAMNAKELTRLGDQYFDGSGVPQDLERAAALYSEAAQLGEPRAMMRYGEALLLGRGIASDPARGVAMLQKAAALRNATAALMLGDIYARGEAVQADPVLSIKMYEQAAASGRDLALLKLAQLYSEGVLVPADSAKAVDYYRKAVNAGRNDALLALGVAFAQRKLGRTGTPAEGLALLEDARRKGVDQAAVYIADCYFNGHGVRRNPAKALKVLLDAWNSGNARAGVRLLSIYRDGRKDAVKRNRFLAEYYFRRVSHALGEDEIRAESILLEATKASTRRSMEGIRQALGGLPANYRSSTYRKMRITNPNVYVYLLQVKLRDLKLYGGRATGLLTKETARSIHKYCLGFSTSDLCRKGPLSSDVAVAISKAL